MTLVLMHNLGTIFHNVSEHVCVWTVAAGAVKLCKVNKPLCLGYAGEPGAYGRASAGSPLAGPWLRRHSASPF